LKKKITKSYLNAYALFMRHTVNDNPKDTPKDTPNSTIEFVPLVDNTVKNKIIKQK